MAIAISKNIHTYIHTRRYEYAGNASRRVQKVIYLQNCMLNSGAFSQCMTPAVYFSLARCPVTIRQAANSG